MKKYFSHLVLATFIVTLFSALGFFAPVIQVRADDRDCSRLDSFGVFVPSNNGMITLGVIGYPNTNTVKIAVPLGTDISKLMTSVKVEPDNINPFCNSVISPPSGSVIDFSHPVVYTVNPFGPLRPGDIRSISDAEALRLARKYTVYVYFPPKITEFKVSAGLLSRNYYGSIDQNARTIALTLPKGIDMTKLIPTIKTFSEGADSVGLNPNYGTLQNQFLNGTIRIRSWYYRQGTSGEIINSYTGGIDQLFIKTKVELIKRSII